MTRISYSFSVCTTETVMPDQAWQKHTASRQNGPGGLPLGLRLSEELGLIRVKGIFIVVIDDGVDLWNALNSLNLYIDDVGELVPLLWISHVS